MRLVIAAVGRLKAGPERELCDTYCERLNASSRRLGLGPVRIVEIAESRAASAEARKADEAERLLDAVRRAQVLAAVDPRGKGLTSEAFAQWLMRERDGGTQELAFLIGGPDGHGPTALARASRSLTLGPWTLPHGLARIVVAEQLYRASTILAGHPYHRA